MMQREQELETLLTSIADGSASEWDAPLEGFSPEVRDLIDQLRLVAEVADAHRRTFDDAEEMPVGAEHSIAGVLARLLQEPHAQLLPLAADAPGADPRGSETAGHPWGRFVLGEKLGEGSFGAVFRAWDPQLERDVAVKLIHPEIAHRGDSAATRLLREGRAIAQVRHENVVSVFGVEEHDGQVGLCMEYVQGRTIEDLVGAEGPMNATAAADIGENVCRALAAVHAADLVHRDVKARNVMRTEAGGRIVLMDFGSGVKLRSPSGVTVPMAGTPIYMAPEVLRGEAPSPRSDVYSVGVLLYYLVSGRYPIEGATLDEIRQAHEAGSQRKLGDWRSDMPVGFLAIVERALDRDPAQRYWNAASMLADLEDWTGDPTRRRLTWAGRVAAGVRRHGPALAGGFAAALAVVIGLGFLSTWSFNYMLGNEGSFVTETPASWLRWGVKSLVAPAVVAAGMTLLAFLCLEVFRLARRISPPLDELVWTLSGRVNGFLHKAGYGPANALAFAVVVASFAFFVVAYFGYFADLALAVGTTLNDASPEQLRLLAPSNEPAQQVYRQVFTMGLSGMLVAWMGVRRMARSHRERIQPLTIAAGGILLVLVVILLSQPYRILLWNEAERVGLATDACYLVGQTTQQARVFCPRETPRTKVVPLAAVERTGEFESIFAPFSGPVVADRR